MSTHSSQKLGARSVFPGGETLRKIFNFFASLQLAVATLLTLMVVLAAGTIIESRYSASAAKVLVYDSPWFAFILVILAINLTCSAADRLPWKKKHIGFVLTHLGIIIILMGSLATQQVAVDGQMSLEEGSKGKWVTLQQPVLYLYSQAFKSENMFPLKERAFRWEGNEKIANLKLEERTAEVTLTRFFPKAQADNQWISAPEGPAAIQVNLQNQFLNVTQWLANEPLSNEILMGPATLRFASELIQPVVEVIDKPYLEITMGEQKLQFPAPEKSALPFEKTFDNGLRVKVLERYDFAYVEENILKEGAALAHAENPALALEISQGEKTEKHTVFSNFPEFPTVHGRPESQFGLTVYYRRPHSGSKGESHELRFVAGAEGLQYQIQTGAKLEQGRVEEGKEIETGWMGLKFRVEKVLPHAKSDLKVTPLEEDDKSEAAVSAAEIQIRTSSTAEKFWVVEGVHKSLMIEGGLFEMVFGRKQIPLGFEMMLKDFRVKNDPGTDRPAAFESDVIVKDFTRGVSIEKTISMNQPLVYRGFRIYQAGYTPNPEGKDSSVFAVGKDPGVPIKYAGAIIMVAGILLMFYTRAYSTRNEKGLT